MVKELIHDPIFLAQKSRPATKEDLNIARDLLDTLGAHRETCVGMAANMIGCAVRIIAFDDNGKHSLMLNPQIIKASGEYETEESCLSLLGGPRKTKGTKRSRCSTRILISKRDSRPSRVGLLRSSSTKWITATVF